MQQLQQKDWIDQQIRERKMFEEQQRFTQDSHDKQTLHFNSLLEQAQNQHQAARVAMETSIKDANAQMAKEKRDRDNAQRAYEQLQARTDVDNTDNHDFMTENPATEQSMLAPHRVKPYHFKGFNAQQTASVMNERQMQMREAEMTRKQEKEAERLWAMQQEHLRRQQVLADRQHKRGLREVAAGTRATQEQQRDEMKARTRDLYNEQTPAFESR